MVHQLIKLFFVLSVLWVAALGQTTTHSPSLIDRAGEFEPLILESARRYGIDARILRSVCFVESRFRTSAVSPKGARGLMQFMPETATRYGLTDPHDPRAAIDAAARYLRDLLKKFGGRVDLAVAAYNAGEGAVESFVTGKPLFLRDGKIINPRGLITGGIPPYSETRAYVGQIMQLLVVPHHQLPPSPVSRNQDKRDARMTMREFTLDVLAEEPQSLKTKPATHSSFIDLGGPN